MSSDNELNLYKPFKYMYVCWRFSLLPVPLPIRLPVPLPIPLPAPLPIPLPVPLPIPLPVLHSQYLGTSSTRGSTPPPLYRKSPMKWIHRTFQTNSLRKYLWTHLPKNRRTTPNFSGWGCCQVCVFVYVQAGCATSTYFLYK